MSPRSEEFMSQAAERLAAARDAIPAGHPTVAIGQAYYAMLYAARAALSERDLHARTHRGAWSMFEREFVAAGAIDRSVGGMGAKTQRAREQADYEAEEFDAETAGSILADAEAFVAAVRQMLE